MLLTPKGMYLSVKNVSRSVRITPVQRLMGQASYGDLVSMSFRDDYTAKFFKLSKKHLVLALTAKSHKATYKRIHLWVDKKTYMPIKSQVFLSSGKVFKHLTYIIKYNKLNKVIYKSKPKSNKKTVMTLHTAVEKKLPKRFFTSSSMRSILPK